MSRDVNANGRSILHKGHGMTHTCAVPDVCKTPTPGGPVPIPYVNIAMDSDITDGAETVKIEGNPVANVSAKISTSTGDEAGSAGGGIISSKIKGTVTWKMGSLDVKAEGKSVVRFLDQDFHNGNSFNTSFIVPGETTGMRYGDDLDTPCPVCHKEMEEHKIIETEESAALCASIIQELKTQFEAAAPGKKGEYAKEWEGKFSGYMVGVMICKHPKGSNPSIFAAMSGTRKPLSGFQSAAKSKGVHVVIGDGAAGGPARGLTWQDFANANPALQGNKQQHIDTAVEAKKRWKTHVEDTKKKNYSCAGAHLVTKAKHGPANMTEMYFMPGGDKRLNISYRARLAGEANETRSTRRFGTNVTKTDQTPWGPTVGSCETCQNLLFLTMCPERTCG